MQYPWIEGKAQITSNYLASRIDQFFAIKKYQTSISRNFSLKLHLSKSCLHFKNFQNYSQLEFHPRTATRDDLLINNKKEKKKGKKEKQSRAAIPWYSTITRVGVVSEVAEGEHRDDLIEERCAVTYSGVRVVQRIGLQTSSSRRRWWATLN